MAARYACVELQRDDCETLSVALNFSKHDAIVFCRRPQSPALIVGLLGKARDDRALAVGVRATRRLPNRSRRFRPWNTSLPATPVSLTVASPDLPYARIASD
jgi:hypothetical protein